jgi:hypothetical protein
VCYISPLTQRRGGATVDSTVGFAQLQLGFVDQTQWRYELIRPLVLFADRTAQQRAQETHTHPDTVRTLQRRFRRQGMRGLLPADVEVAPRRQASPIPEAVRQEIDRLKALYDGFHYRELARIGVSANRLHGFERFNVQHLISFPGTSRVEGLTPP